MKCCEQCGESIPATVHVTYGMFETYREGRPHHKIFLCSRHSSELFEACKAVISFGLMYWLNSEPHDPALIGE